MKWVYRIFGYCHRHGWFKYPKRFRMNTAFIKDEANYSFGCELCKEECDAYYKERWDEYYRGLL